MRLKITLRSKKKQVIPYSYQYHISSAIYSLLRKVNTTTSLKFHMSQPFKGFVFSSLFFKEFQTTPQGILFNGDVTLYVSSINREFIRALLSSILNTKTLRIGSINLNIEDVVFVEDPDFSKINTYSLLSPLLVRKPVLENGKMKGIDLLPVDDEFYPILVRNIHKRYRRIYNSEPLNEIQIGFIDFKPKRYCIKNTCYKCSLGTLKIFADEKTMKLIYHTGLGSKNSMGFGMIGIKK